VKKEIGLKVEKAESKIMNFMEGDPEHVADSYEALES
jgi:hypothetical protein